MNSLFNTNIYKLNIFEYVCREVRNGIDFAYHFINSTVHTSRVIWALKTVKVNECLFTDEKQHGYMEQRLSLLAESWSTPTRWLVLHLLRLSTDLGPGSPCLPFTDQHIDEDRCGRQGREDRLIQAILHNLAFRDQQVHVIPYKLSSKTRSYSKHGGCMEDPKTYGTAHRITHK